MTSRQAECRAAIEVYVRPAFDSPLDDDRPLSIRDFRRHYGFPIDTIYKVDGNKRINEAKEYRARAQEGAGEDSGKRRRIDKVRVDRDGYKDKYVALMEKWILMIDYLQSKKDIDIEEALITHTLPEISRAAKGPVKGRGKKR